MKKKIILVLKIVSVLALAVVIGYFVWSFVNIL